MVEAGLEQVLVRRQAHAVLELGMKVAGAEAGHLGQLDHRDAPRQVLDDIGVQATDIQAGHGAAAALAEQAQVQRAQQHATEGAGQVRVAAVARQLGTGVAQQVLEIGVLQNACAAFGVRVALSEGWEKGGAGMTDLAQAVVETAEGFSGRYRPLYDWNSDIRTKVETVARKIYGAGSVSFQAKALADIKHIEDLGLSRLPVCIAKTQKSFTNNEALFGRPGGFDFSVREFEIAAGAGFLVPIAGSMTRLPGLPAVPAAFNIDIDDRGVVIGLS